MKNSIKSAMIVISIASFLTASCKKDWLEAKPKQSLATISTLKDLESLLESTSVQYSNLGELGSDDYSITADNFKSLSILEQNAYAWASGGNVYGGQNLLYDWDYIYNYLFAVNTIIESSDKIHPSEAELTRWKNAKGRAYFYRAWYHYNLAQLFCKPYNQSTASSDLGIILRLEADVNIPSKRSTVRATYESIVGDLQVAQTLLTDLPTYKSQPSKISNYALLSRVNLIMADYGKALENANLCLNIDNELLDYNTVDATSDAPFQMYSKEVLFWADMVFSSSIPSQYGISFVNSALYESYSEDDLRKQVFFGDDNGRVYFKGSYASYSYVPFAGIALDEVYLIKAECLARNGDLSGSLNTLNILLRNRWNALKPFVPFETADQSQLIQKVLSERRKELCFRGLRWSDLRRLNLEEQYKITIHRGLLGSNVNYSLPPNDNRYVYPFPENEITYSNVEQNPR